MEFVSNLIGYAAGVIGAAMFFPQAIKSWKTKQTKDLSLLTYSLLLTQSILWIIYGVLSNSGPVIFVNIIVVSISIFILILKSHYG